MENKIYSKVFGWLFIGLMLTFISGFLISTSEEAIRFLFSGSMYMIVFIAQLVIAVFLGARIFKMDPTISKILYLTYSLLTGVTFGSIFLIFKMSSIIFIFLVTSLIFGIFAVIGSKVKMNLGKFSTYLFMALIAIIILEIINIFLMNNTLDIVLCGISVLIFMGFTAYDIQKVKQLCTIGYDTDTIAILGAFELYLDFVNLFIDLIKLFGKER